jgi:GLPGLI family protein
MKKILILLTITSFFLLESQNSGFIKYNVSIENNFIEVKSENAKTKNKNLSLVNDALKENIDQFNFDLKFLFSESIFNLDSKMNSDNASMKFKIARALLEANNEYYTNSTENIKLTQINAYGEKFILKDSLSNWKLTKDTKKIGKYLCYKSTTIKTVINSKGTFVKNVEAWYAPELSFPFGPKGYGGLPGLILELTEDKIVYRATLINMKKEIKKISKPSNGKLVTNEEFLDIGNKVSENRY